MAIFQRSSPFFSLNKPKKKNPPLPLAAGKHRPGERALWDGGNEEKRRPHPDGRHAGDGNQPPQPVSRADAQADGRGDPGEPGRERAN